MRKIIKKGDIALLVIFAAAALLIACIPFLRSRSGEGAGRVSGSEMGTASSSAASGTDSGSEVVITVAGSVYGTWPLSEDQVIEVNNSYGSNEVTIRDGSVAVTKSDCANQICVDTGWIRDEGQMILCLPHRLSIEIRAGEQQEEEYDAIVR